MNPSQLTEISIAICNTIDHLRGDLPEPTRTALQTHLNALLKEELRALTGQAPEGNLVAEYVQAELERVKGALQRDDALGRAWVDPRKDSEPTPWYPDDSGEWVEVAADSTEPPVAEAVLIDYLLLGERARKGYTPAMENAGALNWTFEANDSARIVAYKVVEPCE